MIAVMVRKITHLRPARLSGLTVLALAALATGAQAQISSETQSAMRANCRSDFMSQCSGVTPGGKEALTCLQTNVAKLSPACQTAVRKTLPPPAPPPARAVAVPPPPPAPKQAVPAAPAPAPTQAVAAPPPPAAPTAAQQSAMRSSCRNDFMSLCSGVSPGGKDALVCLQRNVARLSPACSNVVSATIPKTAPAPAAPKAAALPQRPAAPAAIAPAAVAPASAPAEAAPAPTAQQMQALKFTCGRDFKANCSGVAPGGPEALACLQRNAARLSPNCGTAVADIADSAPVAAPVAAAAPAPAAAEKRPLPPGITPAGRIIRRVIEHRQNQ